MKSLVKVESVLFHFCNRLDGYEIICGAPTTLVVKGLMMMMMRRRRRRRRRMVMMVMVMVMISMMRRSKTQTRFCCI